MYSLSSYAFTRSWYSCNKIGSLSYHIVCSIESHGQTWVSSKLLSKKQSSHIMITCKTTTCIYTVPLSLSLRDRNKGIGTVGQQDRDRDGDRGAGTGTVGQVQRDKGSDRRIRTERQGQDQESRTVTNNSDIINDSSLSSYGSNVTFISNLTSFKYFCQVNHFHQN